MHWDADTSQKPAPEGVQGVLYLADTAENQGGFQCAPSLFREMMRDYEAWVDAQPADRNPARPDLTGHPVLPIPGRTGDLLIWHRLLAHGNGHNVSGKPRFAQYITMFPARPEDTAARDARITCWRDRLPPTADWAPGDPRRWEQTHGTTADLTPLGRRLLGLDDW
jgi:ectoine hydroxylase-related dioxygenase (phytanoyl-CoA dioxygenase family)